VSRLFKAVIIDDEPPARRLLAGILKEYPTIIDLAGEADSGAGAIALINSRHPDVIFLDIRLPDMLGFDVIRDLNYNPFIIFTTAYDQYAIKAFDEFSIDYLLKPVKKQRLSKTLAKLQGFVNYHHPDPDAFEDMAKRLKERNEVRTFSVKQGNKFLLIALSDILYFQAYDRYSFIYLADGQKVFCDYMLSTVEDKLPGDFIRVQKSYVVNKNKIFKIHKYSNSRFTIILNDRSVTSIVTGPSYFDIIREVFSI